MSRPLQTVRCPQCRKKLAELPAGEGRYRIRCPRCGAVKEA